MIEIRPVLRSDASIIAAMRSNYTSYRNEWITPLDDQSFVKEASMEIEDKKHGWFIIVNDVMPIGVLRVAPSMTMTEAMEIDYVVAACQRGRGYATDAVMAGIRLFQGKTKRFVIRIDEANHASTRVAQKCGFKLTATIDRGVDYGTGPKGTLLVFERTDGELQQNESQKSDTPNGWW